MGSGPSSATRPASWPRAAPRRNLQDCTSVVGAAGAYDASGTSKDTAANCGIRRRAVILRRGRQVGDGAAHAALGHRRHQL